MRPERSDLLARVHDGHAPSDTEALALSACEDLAPLMAAAAELRDRGHGTNMS